MSSERTQQNPEIEQSNGNSPSELMPDAEKTALIQDSSFTNRDYLFLFFYLLVAVGDAIELYLPGVITQAVSCELGVSRVQEGWLGIIIYTTMAAGLLIAGALSNR